MSIKEQLKEAVVSSDTTAITEALTSVFESVELSPDVKSKFSTVFEGVIKAKAVDLADQYISEAAVKADALIAEHKASLNEAAEQYSKYIAEQFESKLDVYLDHVVETWLEQNKLAVEAGLKVEMFDNLVSGLKTMFVENNIVVPTDAVDVVKELEEEIQDLENKLDQAITESTEQKRILQGIEKQNAIARVCGDLTESQKEKVKSLAESISFSNEFESNLRSIVEFATLGKLGTSTLIKEKEEGSEEYKDGEEEGDEKKKKDGKDKEEMKESFPQMDAYLAAAKRMRS